MATVQLPDTDASADAAPAFSPLYQQIKALITKSLQGGEWKPGEAIPSEMELAARPVQHSVPFLSQRAFLAVRRTHSP
jgi:DNA-binding transcriptional regulator YhcF (GntR family)